MLMGSVAALLCSSSPAQNTSAPRPDFLQVDYAPLWPAKFDGGITSWGNQVSAASTGDGGWLTAWFEGGIGGRARLMARLLPPAFDDPAPALAPPLSWTGNALPPRVVAASTVFDAMSLSGEDGGLLAWKDVAGLRAVWLAQGTSALPAEPAILTNGYPGGAYLMGAADGSRFWLLTNAYATPEPGRGLLLEKTISGVRVVKEFYASGGHFPFLQMTAHRGQCLVSSYYYSYSQTGNGVRTAGVRTLTVDAAGAVSAVRELELPANTYWLGAVAHGEGYYGYWSTFYPPAGDILYGRAMTLEGGWKADSTAEVVGPVATEGYTLHLTSGPQAGVLKTGSRAWLLRPGRPMTLLQNTFGGDTFALSPIRILALGIEADGRLLATRRTFDYDTTRPDLTASLALGAGRAGDVSLAWTQRGPQVVCEVDNYGTQGGLTLSGYNGMAAAQPGAQFLTGPFSSPAQAWAI